MELRHRTLIKALDRRGYRVGKSRRYAIMGLSMGGNAALTIGAQNRQHFDRAGSLSGYTWLSAPGMRTMIRLAMLDVARRDRGTGFDVGRSGACSGSRTTRCGTSASCTA